MHQVDKPGTLRWLLLSSPCGGVLRSLSVLVVVLFLGSIRIQHIFITCWLYGVSNVFSSRSVCDEICTRGRRADGVLYGGKILYSLYMQDVVEVMHCAVPFCYGLHRVVKNSCKTQLFPQHLYHSLSPTRTIVSDKRTTGTIDTLWVCHCCHMARLNC